VNILFYVNVEKILLKRVYVIQTLAVENVVMIIIVYITLILDMK